MFPLPETKTWTGVIQQVMRAQQLPRKLPARGDTNNAKTAARMAKTIE
jgi:hypothetical protein